MRIGIDCRLAGMAHGGIGRYVSQLVLHLVEFDSSYSWVFVFADQSQVDELWSKPPKNVEVHICPVRHYTFAEQLRMPGVWQRLNVDLLHVPHFNIPVLYSGKMVVTIHDLLWHQRTGSSVTTLPSWQYRLKYLAYQWLTRQAVEHAERVFVPSQTIAKTIIHYFPFAAAKIVVTTEGVSSLFWESAPATRSTSLKKWKLPSTRKFLLYVGSLYPHKNVELIVQALAKLPAYDLLLVGTRNVFRERFQNYVGQRKMQKRVHFLGRVSDRELVDLLAVSEVLVQPSFSEGFGLTGVEALAAGFPLLASDIPVFHEVYQDHASFFDPNSVRSFVTALAKVKVPNVTVQRLLRQQFSWKKMSQQTLQQYQAVLADTPLKAS